MTASSNFNVPLVFRRAVRARALGVALLRDLFADRRRVTGWATRKKDLIAT